MAVAEERTDPAPERIFADSDDVATLWAHAYQGEVFGEALFERIAALVDDADRARKMRVLAALERRTKEEVAPAVARAGVSTDPDPEMLAGAESLAPSLAGSWEQLMEATVPVTAQFIPLYVRLAELDPSERTAADLLVAHEEALAAFARAELAGDAAHSLERVESLPHMV